MGFDWDKADILDRKPSTSNTLVTSPSVLFGIISSSIQGILGYCPPFSVRVNIGKIGYRAVPSALP